MALNLEGVRLTAAQSSNVDPEVSGKLSCHFSSRSTTEEIMNYVETFEKDGFLIVPEALALDALGRLETLILERAQVDLAESGVSTNGAEGLELLRLLEKTSPQRFFKLCAIGSGIGGMQIACAPKVTEIIASLFGISPSQMFCFPPAIFWNDKPVTRLQYRWHQESSYLNAYDQLITLWTPLFRNLKVEDGPMIVARGSHKEVYPYSHSREPGGVTQYSIEDSITSRFEHVPCAIKRGDAVLFHRDLIHKTGDNLVNQPRISIIIRYFNELKSSDFEPLLRPNNKTPKDAVTANSIKTA